MKYACIIIPMNESIIPKEGKDKTYWDILNAGINLDIQHGHLKWTYAQLSRKASVTRSLIYYYFGKSKITILEEACRLFGEILAGTAHPHMRLWKDGDLTQPLVLSRDILKNCDSLLPFYYLNRDKKNNIGDLIRDYEKKGIKKRKQFFPNLTISQCRALFALQLGISTYPGLEQADIQVAVDMIKIPN